jgi:hypothetical protein
MADSSDGTQAEPRTGLPPGGAAAPTARTEARPVPSTGQPDRVPAHPTAYGNGRPSDPAELRLEIERTRARLSGTLDAIEARIAHDRAALEEKKDEVIDRVTLKGLRRRLSREPWRSVAIAFVAGYVVAAIRD